MRRRGIHQQEASDVNVTPLLDIVFIMLIFFIVTATFIDEDGISLANPNDNNQDNPNSSAETLVLSINEDGSVRVNDFRTIDPRSVRSNVETFIAQNPESSVLISANPNSETGVAVLVLDQVKQAGANVSLVLQKEQ